MAAIVRAVKAGERHIARFFDSEAVASEVASAFYFLLSDNRFDEHDSGFWLVSECRTKALWESSLKSAWVEVEYASAGR